MKKERTIVSIGILLAIVLALIVSLYNQPALESQYHYYKDKTISQFIPPQNYVYLANDTSATWTTEGEYYVSAVAYNMTQGDTLTVTYSGWIE